MQDRDLCPPHTPPLSCVSGRSVQEGVEVGALQGTCSTSQHHATPTRISGRENNGKFID